MRFLKKSHVSILIAAFSLNNEGALYANIDAGSPSTVARKDLNVCFSDVISWLEEPRWETRAG